MSSRHQHDLEHIVENRSKVNYVSTGAGKFCCYNDTNLDTVPRGSIKFAMSGPAGSQWQPMPFEVLSGFTSYRCAPARTPSSTLLLSPRRLLARNSDVDFLRQDRIRVDGGVLPRAQWDGAVHDAAHPEAHQGAAAGPGAAGAAVRQGAGRARLRAPALAAALRARLGTPPCFALSRVVCCFWRPMKARVQMVARTSRARYW